ncbi:MAG: autotransporter-associated beta strand repeat-containing protein, partial [Planctomycetes bacterium]|nr:autotransporter-associated beta strand repeat-containing protein [Planctomycetota bacterium]
MTSIQLQTEYRLVVRHGRGCGTRVRTAAAGVSRLIPGGNMRRKSWTSRKCAAVAAAAISPLLVPAAASAVDSTWNLNANGNWSVAGNWSAGVPNAVGDTARFLNVTTANRIVTQNVSGLTLGALVFNDDNNYSISGSTSITLDSTVGESLITVLNTLGNGAHAINVPLVLNDPLQIDHSSSGTFTTSGAISGSFGLEKAGSGTYTMIGSNPNTYTGTTTVSGGVLNLNKPVTNATIVGGLVIGDGSGTDTVRLLANAQIADGVAITINSSGVLDVNGRSEIFGGLNLTGGSVVGTGSSFASISGAITSNAHSSPALISLNTFSLGGLSRTFTVADGSAPIDLDISSTITGAASGYVKAGLGTLRLSGASATVGSGAVTVNEGTLLLGKTVTNGAIQGLLSIGDGTGGANADVVRLETHAQIDDNQSVFINSSGLLDLNGFQEAVNFVQMTGGTVNTGAGALTILLAVNAEANPTRSTINGNLSFLGGTRLFGVEDGADDVDLELSGVVSNGGLTKGGDGTLALTGSAANTYTGMTTVHQGTLLLSKSAPGVTAVAGNLVIGDVAGSAGSAVARIGSVNEAIADTSSVTIHPDGLFDVNGKTETIAGLTMTGGSVTLGGGTLIVDGNVSSNGDAATATIGGGTLSLAAAVRTFNVVNGA